MQDDGFPTKKKGVKLFGWALTASIFVSVLVWAPWRGRIITASQWSKREVIR